MDKKYLLVFFVLLWVGLLYRCWKENEKGENKCVNGNEYGKHKWKMDEDWERYEGEVYDVFYQGLIREGKVGFRGDREEGKGKNDWMISVSEFKNWLKELYKNN